MAIHKLGAALCGLMALLLLQPTVAEAAPPLRIAPVQSHPGGQSYEHWAAEWWQWALETPASVNPILDDTGEHCQEGQIGHVWFLGGDFVGDGSPVTRTCEIPSGTALFFPLVNLFYGAFLDDPEETRTEQFIREQVDCGEPANQLLLTLDGRQATGLERFFVESVIFDVRLPDDNVFDVLFGIDLPETLLSPSVSAGYYVFLHPLPPGEYTLHWEASWCGFVQDVTYTLEVRRGRSGR